MLEEDGKHHQHNQLDWDDTPLTITVNPMQNWVDEDEEQGIEYLMGGKGKRGMSKLGGPTLHLSGAGHLVENEDELDTSDSEERTRIRRWTRTRRMIPRTRVRRRRSWTSSTIA